MKQLWHITIEYPAIVEEKFMVIATSEAEALQKYRDTGGKAVWGGPNIKSTNSSPHKISDVSPVFKK